jgi:hypothetical protein
LQIASDLSVFTKDVFDISFVNGPGLTSTFPSAYERTRRDSKGSDMSENSNVSDDDIKFESFSPNIMRRDRDGAV